MSFWKIVCIAIASGIGSFAVAAECPSVPHKFPQPRVNTAAIEEWLKELQSSKAVECRQLGGNVLQCYREMEIWLFTQPGHAAHPAVSHAVLLTCNAETYISRIGNYAGNLTAFSAWFEDLKDYDRQSVERFRNSR